MYVFVSPSPISITIKCFVPHYLIWFDPIWSDPIQSNTIQSNTILSQLDNECNIIYSSLFINDGGFCIYIYIYGCNLFVILYNDGFVLVWIIESRYPALSIVYWVSSYLQRIMTTKSFTITFRLLVVVLIDDCWLLYVYLYISTICWYYSCSFFVVYVHNIVRCLVLQLLI